jgi:polar amino acid transport system permease protein
VSASEAAPERVVPLRHPWRWLGAFVAVALLASLIASLVNNRNIDHATISTYLAQDHVLEGLRNTVILTVVAMAIGIAVGTLLAVMRLSPNVVLRSVAWLYIWFFRGTPLLVQILIWGNLAILFQHLVLGIPWTDVSLFSADTNSVVTTFVAGLLALWLNEGAYMAEIVRAGILSVDPGQAEAAASIGMHRGQIMRRVVLPQAARVIVPPTGNELQNMIKNTSLVSIVAGHDLLTSVQDIYSSNLRVLELLTVACFWYLVLSTITTIGQFYVERRFASGPQPPTPIQRIRALARR